TNPFQAWLAKVGWEIAVAVALAAALAISTGATSTLFFRYLVVGSLIAGTVSTPIDKHDPLPGSWFFPRAALCGSAA
ncbi:hypothetical protein, partial [Bradyrhizobium campsiandrae]|uniref:hypothetical protein n=1 Tax=Bradyrhizobium campsiandrae TaxID=1729892 RepID=UPI001AEF0F12